MSRENKSITQEFKSFIDAEPMTPPPALSAKILTRVHEDLNPTRLHVFSKVLLIHLVVGTVTLLFCPQFGLGLYKDIGVMAVLMRFGHHVCMVGCGAIFLGSSALIASLLLRPEELAVVRRSQLVQFAALGVLSIAVLAIAGAEIALIFAASWLVGSVAGASVGLESGWALRRLLRSHA